ncbi:MAG TPA: porin [Chthoniobacterales bacterium]|nr:porin [Chthoniobacterales bacterium]
MNQRTIRRPGATFALFFLILPLLAGAQTKEEFEELKQQLRALQAKTERLERRLAHAEAHPAARPEKAAVSSVPATGGNMNKSVVELVPSALVTADENGFAIKSADDSFKLRIGGLIHADGRFFIERNGRDAATDTFLLRRVRPILEGKIYDDFGFRIMPDFGGGSAVLQDAYLEYTRFEGAQLRVGKFKEPVGLERLQSASDNLFVERGLPTDLVPNRDVGVQLSGAFFEKTLTYQLGLFNGVVDGGSGDLDNNDEKDIAARVWLQPFQQARTVAWQGLNIGFAGTYGLQDGALPVFRSASQQTFFSYDTETVAQGARWRLAPQAYYSLGPFGLLAEYVRSEQEIGSAAGLTADSGAEAWQVAASYVLTGERASFKGVKPRQNVGDGGWGSWEIVARYGELEVDREPFDLGLASASRSARSAHSFGLGLNWNLNKNVRAMFDFDHTAFDGGALAGDRADENTIFTRLQIGF